MLKLFFNLRIPLGSLALEIAGSLRVKLFIHVISGFARSELLKMANLIFFTSSSSYQVFLELSIFFTIFFHRVYWLNILRETAF